MANSMMMNDATTQIHRGKRERSALQVWFQETARKLSDTMTWYRTYRETVQELNRLSERELDDIGIARGDISMIALQSANTKTAAR